MKTHTAVALDEIGPIDGVKYEVGSPLSLIESEEYNGYYWIVQNGEKTRSLVTNNYGNVFELEVKLKKAS